MEEITLYRANLKHKKIYIWKAKIEIRKKSDKTTPSRVGFDPKPPEAFSPAVIKLPDFDKKYYAVILMENGLLSGAMKKSTFEITQGKNKGKKNWTNSWMQAKAELKSRAETKLKEGGYYKTLKEAQEALNDSKGPGFNQMITPMAAELYRRELISDMEYVYVQPKLDGQRVMAYIDSESQELVAYTRGQEKVINYPEIREEMKIVIKALVSSFSEYVQLDGEIYVHGKKLQEFIGIYRKEKLDSGDMELMSRIKFNLFDIFVPDEPDLGFEDRFVLTTIDIVKGLKLKHIVIVPTHKASTHKKIETIYEKYIAQGYEGVMVRTPFDPYPRNRGQNRVKFLLKLKPWFDIDCKIIDYKEGRGTKKGTPIWKLIPLEYEKKQFPELNTKKSFWVAPGGSHETRAKMFREAKTWLGKIIVVRFQAISTDGTPQRPQTNMTLVMAK